MSESAPKKRKTKADASFVRVKHVAPKEATNPRVVWVSRRSNQAHLLRRCSELLDKEGSEVVINGLGAAIVAAVNLSLELNRQWNDQLVLDVATSTVSLTDELRPLADETDSKIETRLNSAVRIIVRRKPKKPQKK
jgi:ribonuclease P/MRP protein subunit RPP20